MGEELEREVQSRVEFIRRQLQKAGAKGIVYGNSGGKDSALVGILCKKACENTLGLCMPCTTPQNYGRDLRDAKRVAEKFGIETAVVDLTAAKKALAGAAESAGPLSGAALSNLAPRLRMAVLYAVAQSREALVAGTGNRSEGYLGYFTKWGDGACDFNPIADLTVTEVYRLLRYLGAPEPVIAKAPSAGLFPGQTDEGELGIRYDELDALLLTGSPMPERLRALHEATAHKRCMPAVYKREEDGDAAE